MSERSLISYERVKVIICHKICNISFRTCYNRSRIPKYFLDMSANGSWLIESTLTSQHDIKSFFDLEIYLSTFNSLNHLKVHLTILTLQDYVIPSTRQLYGLLRSLRAYTVYTGFYGIKQSPTTSYDSLRTAECLELKKITLVVAFSRFIIGIIFFGSFIFIAKAFLGFYFDVLNFWFICLKFIWHSARATVAKTNGSLPEQGRNFKK